MQSRWDHLYPVEPGTLRVFNRGDVATQTAESGTVITGLPDRIPFFKLIRVHQHSSACPVQFVYDSAVYPVGSGNRTGAYFTGAANNCFFCASCAFLRLLIHVISVICGSSQLPSLSPPPASPPVHTPAPSSPFHKKTSADDSTSSPCPNQSAP